MLSLTLFFRIENDIPTRCDIRIRFNYFTILSCTILNWLSAFDNLFTLLKSAFLLPSHVYILFRVFFEISETFDFLERRKAIPEVHIQSFTTSSQLRGKGMIHTVYYLSWKEYLDVLFPASDQYNLFVDKAIQNALSVVHISNLNLQLAKEIPTKITIPYLILLSILSWIYEFSVTLHLWYKEILSLFTERFLIATKLISRDQVLWECLRWRSRCTTCVIYVLFWMYLLDALHW
jgi:hypothetical protein